MTNKIRGKDFVIYMDVDGVQTPICCGKDLTLNITHEVKEATKAPSSKWKSYVEGVRSFTVASTQLVLVTPKQPPRPYDPIPLPPGIQLKDIFAHLASGTPVNFVMGNLSIKEGMLIDNSMFFSGKIIIDSIQINGTDSEIATYTFTGVGDGVLGANNPYVYTIISSGEDGQPKYGAPLTEWSPLLPIDLTTDC